MAMARAGCSFTVGATSADGNASVGPSEDGSPLEQPTALPIATATERTHDGVGRIPSHDSNPDRRGAMA